MFHLTHGSETVDSKMAQIDVQLKQWTVLEFLVAEGEKPTCIHEHLLNMYGEVTVGVSTGKWVTKIKSQNWRRSIS
jgi:hypothetical protein